MLNASLQSVTKADNVITLNTLSEHLQTVAPNSSDENDCVKVNISRMEYVPWDNPDNIVSKEVEHIVSIIKNNLVVLLFLIGGPANIINMAVFYKQGLRDRVNLCLFALSLTDELFLIMQMLQYGEQLHLQFTTKERIGRIFTFLVNNDLLIITGFCFISPVLSAIIAIERCICVFNPLKFHILLRTRTMAVIIIVIYIVLLGMVYTMALRFYIGCLYDVESGVAVVTFTEAEVYKAHKTFLDALDMFVFGVGLPVGEMVVVIIATVLTIVKLRQAVTWRSGSSSSFSAREVALTKMLVGNSILFIVCSLPFALYRFSWLFLPEMNPGRRHYNLFQTGMWIIEISALINSTFNIVVYYVMGSRYRETFWALFSRKLKPVKA